MGVLMQVEVVGMAGRGLVHVIVVLVILLAIMLLRMVVLVVVVMEVVLMVQVGRGHVQTQPNCGTGQEGLFLLLTNWRIVL